MGDRIDVQLGALIDHAQDLDAQAAQLKSLADQLQSAMAALGEQTSGEATDAALASTARALIETRARAARLTRNAATVRNLAGVYESCDLAGARGLGE